MDSSDRKLWVLPVSVIINVLGYLPVRDLLSFSLVSRACLQLVTEEWQLWRQLMVNDRYMPILQYETYKRNVCNSCVDSPTCPQKSRGAIDEFVSVCSRVLTRWQIHYMLSYASSTNWSLGKYHTAISRSHKRHVVAVTSNKNAFFSVGKDGKLIGYERESLDIASTYQMKGDVVAASVVNEKLICLADDLGSLNILSLDDFGKKEIKLLSQGPFLDGTTYRLKASGLTKISDSASYFFVAALGEEGDAVTIRVDVIRKPSQSKLSITQSMIGQFKASNDDVETFEIFWLDTSTQSWDPFYIFVSAFDCPVAVYHLISGDCILRIEDVCDVVYAFAFDPAANQIVTGDNEGKIVVWRVHHRRSHLNFSCPRDESFEEVDLLCERVMSHPPEVYCITLTGVITASGSSDSSIRLWHTPSGHPLHILKGHIGIVRHLRVISDTRLVSAGDQKRVIIWDLNKLIGDPSRHLANLNPSITDAMKKSTTGESIPHSCLVVHRSPLFIEHFHVDHFSCFVGSPDFPGAVASINFW